MFSIASLAPTGSVIRLLKFVSFVHLVKETTFDFASFLHCFSILNCIYFFFNFYDFLPLALFTLLFFSLVSYVIDLRSFFLI